MVTTLSFVYTYVCNITFPIPFQCIYMIINCHLAQHQEFKGLVKMTFPSHLQYLNGSLSKGLSSSIFLPSDSDLNKHTQSLRTCQSVVLSLLPPGKNTYLSLPPPSSCNPPPRVPPVHQRTLLQGRHPATRVRPPLDSERP